MESSNFTTTCSILLLFVYCLRRIVQLGKDKTKEIVGNSLIIAKSQSLSYFPDLSYGMKDHFTYKLYEI